MAGAHRVGRQSEYGEGVTGERRELDFVGVAAAVTRTTVPTSPAWRRWAGRSWVRATVSSSCIPRSLPHWIGGHQFGRFPRRDEPDGTDGWIATVRGRKSTLDDLLDPVGSRLLGYESPFARVLEECATQD